MILCESEKKIVQFHEKILNDVENIFFCVKTLICFDFWHCSNFPKKKLTQIAILTLLHCTLFGQKLHFYKHTEEKKPYFTRAQE